MGGHGLASWEPHPRHPRPAPQLVSRGCETRELALPRDGQGRLGFDVDTEGFITHVERFTFAETQGLRPGARLLRVCGQTLPSLGPEGAAQLLRSAPKVCVTVLPPDEGGRPRRSELQAWGGTGGGRGSGHWPPCSLLGGCSSWRSPRGSGTPMGTLLRCDRVPPPGPCSLLCASTQRCHPSGERGLCAPKAFSVIRDAPTLRVASSDGMQVGPLSLSFLVNYP